jgi:DNA-binding NarL/FixJ family response regulator
MSLLQIEDAEPVSLSPALVVEDDPAMRERLPTCCPRSAATSRRSPGPTAWPEPRNCSKSGVYGVVLVDIGLPDGSGVELIGWMRARTPALPAVVVSAWRTEEIIFAALRAGAIGYLLKERDDLELSIALRSIEQGGAPIDPSIARRILGWLAAQQPAARPPSCRRCAGARCRCPCHG